MRRRYLLALLLLFGCVSAGVETTQATLAIVRIGAGNHFVERFTNPKWNTEGEYSLFQFDNGTIREFYNEDPELAPLYYRDSSDADLQTWTAKTQTLSNCVFNTVAKDPATGHYYAIGREWSGGIGMNAHTQPVVMWKSTDNGATFSEINGGNAVLTQSGTTSNIYYRIYNMHLSIVDNVFHVWIECAFEPATSMVQWGTAYSYAPVSDTPNFDTNRSSGFILPQSVAPFAIHVPDRNAWLVIHGQFISDSILDGHGGVWSNLQSSYASASADLADPSNWRRTPRFKLIGPDVDASNKRSISDPAIFEVTGKTNKTILFYNYDQSAANIEYSDLTLTQLYDSMLSDVSFRGTLKGTIR